MTDKRLPPHITEDDVRLITKIIFPAIAAVALEDAAAKIRKQAGADECAMHDVSHESQLPELSRVMLNGVTRASERLVAEATRIRTSHQDSAV